MCRTYLSTSLVIRDALGTHSKSGRLSSWRTHSVPLIICMSPLVGLLMKCPVLTSSGRRSCGGVDRIASVPRKEGVVRKQIHDMRPLSVDTLAASLNPRDPLPAHLCSQT